MIDLDLLTPKQGLLYLALAHYKGRIVAYDTVMRLVGVRNRAQLASHLCRLRLILRASGGEEEIVVFYRKGYMLRDKEEPL